MMSVLKLFLMLVCPALTVPGVVLSLALQLQESVARAASGSAVEPFVRTEWHQYAPFNSLVPRDSLGRECPAGCGPVAMAQVMNFMRYPASGFFGAYDYAAIASGDTAAAARLIADCGRGAGTRYDTADSWTNMERIAASMKLDFGFSHYMSILSRDEMMVRGHGLDFTRLIAEELRAGRPVIFCGSTGRDKNAAGHIFVVDGCAAGRLHANMGWGGRGDGFYHPDRMNGYGECQFAIVGIGDSAFVPERQTYHVSAPGTLSSLLHRDCVHAVVSGRIDSADIAALRRLALEEGMLRTIDLSGASLAELPDSAFAGCARLTYVSLPADASRVGDWAFRGCHNLSYVRMPESLEYINNFAFEGCRSMTAADLPPALKTIGYRSFRGCASLRDVVMPDSMRYLGAQAFTRCPGLRSLTVSAALRFPTEKLITRYRTPARIIVPAANKRLKSDGTSLIYRNPSMMKKRTKSVTRSRKSKFRK